MTNKTMVAVDMLARRIARAAYDLEKVTLSDIDASMICEAIIHKPSLKNDFMALALKRELPKAFCEAHPADCGAVDPLDD